MAPPGPNKKVPQCRAHKRARSAMKHKLREFHGAIKYQDQLSTSYLNVDGVTDAVMRDDVGRSMLCGGVCRKTETGRGRACVDGQIAADNVLGGVCQGELCVGGCGEGCLVLASGGGGETVGGTQIDSQFEMEEDWTRTEPGTQMKLGGHTVHSTQGEKKSHVPRTASRHSLKGKINFWESLGQGESGQAARNWGPAPKILADRQEGAKRNHVA